MQYIILDDQKRATHTFAKDKGGGKTWDEVKDFDNIGLIVPEPFIVLDFDTTSDAEIMLNIVEALDLKCRVMKTTRGIHVWFKSVEPWKCFKKTRLAIGIYSDCKSHSKNAYVKIKESGVMREWIRKTPTDQIEEVPKWLYPVSNPTNQFLFKGMTDGSGRNQELFNYIVYLQTKLFTRDEVKKTIKIINEYVFADPLSEFEISTICRDEAFKPDDVIAKQIEEAEKKAGFNHVDVAEELIIEHNLINYNGVIYEHLDGYYQPCESLGKYVRNKVYAIKNNQRNEVVSYINDMKKITTDQIDRCPYTINTKNTRFDLKTGKCLPFDSSVIEFAQLPVVYDPSAYCADLDKMLNRVFLGDREVINLFEEMIGACLLKHNRYQKAFMLYGGGSNGKSTILDLIKRFLGSRNCASIPLEKVTDRFNVAELENRLANIGDDIDNVTIKDTGTLKKLFAGNSIQVERKGERPFTIEPYATHIYSANNIPRSFDKSDGFYRRWLFIPFNAKFTAADPDYDPLIEDKITTENALSYLLNIGIRGAQRLIKRGRFTEPESVREALEAYKADNSTTLSWIEDKELELDYFLENPTDKLYADFGDWCKLSGIKPGNVTGKKTFFKEIIAKYEFEDKPRQKSGGKRHFVLKIE